jgi:hypothetical protein
MQKITIFLFHNLGYLATRPLVIIRFKRNV